MHMFGCYSFSILFIDFFKLFGFLANKVSIALFIPDMVVLEGYKSITRVMLNPPVAECVEFKNRFLTYLALLICGF